MEGEYDIFYSSSSEVAHATTQKEMITHHGNEIVFEQIRNVDGFDQIVRYAASLIFRTYRIILEKYRPEEAASSFKRRYRDEWRTPFLNIPKVVVEGGEVTKI
jgi:hypothetical protein